MALAFQPYSPDFTVLPTTPPSPTAVWPALPPGSLGERARAQGEPLPGRETQKNGLGPFLCGPTSNGDYVQLPGSTLVSF